MFKLTSVTVLGHLEVFTHHASNGDSSARNVATRPPHTLGRLAQHAIGPFPTAELFEIKGAMRWVWVWTLHTSWAYLHKLNFAMPSYEIETFLHMSHLTHKWLTSSGDPSTCSQPSALRSPQRNAALFLLYCANTSPDSVDSTNELISNQRQYRGCCFRLWHLRWASGQCHLQIFTSSSHSNVCSLWVWSDTTQSHIFTVSMQPLILVFNHFWAPKYPSVLYQGSVQQTNFLHKIGLSSNCGKTGFLPLVNHSPTCSLSNRPSIVG